MHLVGVQHDTIFASQPYGLPLNETTTPQYLKSLGYRTHGVGKVKKDKQSFNGAKLQFAHPVKFGLNFSSSSVDFNPC